MFGVFLKLLIFRVMIARAIKRWLQAPHVLVEKNVLFVCVSENEHVCVYMSACTLDIFSTLILDCIGKHPADFSISVSDVVFDM